jgi:hypothetical protein
MSGIPTPRPTGTARPLNQTVSGDREYQVFLVRRMLIRASVANPAGSYGRPSS